MSVIGKLASWSFGSRRQDGEGLMPSSANHGKRSLSVATALLSMAGLVGGIAVVTAAPALALGPGQVCMVNEPTGAPSSGGTLGHVGWMFMIGGTSQWVAGSTDGAVSASNPKKVVWTRTGTKSALLNFFYSWGYTRFRCHSTNTSSVGAAQNMVAARDAQNFDTLWDNCLDDTVAIFRAYDSSIVMGDPTLVEPNGYFVHLDSFGPIHALSANN